MSHNSTPLKSINYWMRRSWKITGVFAAIAFSLSQLYFLYTEYRRDTEAVKSALEITTAPVSSALFREIMDPKHSLIQEVIQELKSTYHLPVLTVTDIAGVCESKNYSDCVSIAQLQSL